MSRLPAVTFTSPAGVRAMLLPEAEVMVVRAPCKVRFWVVAPRVKPTAGVMVEDENVVPPTERVLVTEERFKIVPPWERARTPTGEIVTRFVPDDEAASKRLAVWEEAPSSLNVVVPAEVD